MSKIVKIPTSMNPFVVIINGMKHEYPAGETVEVADHIAEIIEQYEKGNFPQPALPATEINMVSPGGKVFTVTVSDDGELAVTPKITDAEFFFKLEGVTYIAEKGMTWGEWLESKYAPTYACEDCGTKYPAYELDGGVDLHAVGGCDECDERCLLDQVYGYYPDGEPAGVTITTDTVIDPNLEYC